MATISVQGWPGGAPPEAYGATTDIAPYHGGLSPSDTPLPYSVDLSDFTGGEFRNISEWETLVTIFSHVANWVLLMPIHFNYLYPFSATKC